MRGFLILLGQFAVKILETYTGGGLFRDLLPWELVINDPFMISNPSSIMFSAILVL